MGHAFLPDPPTLKAQLSAWATWFRRYQHCAPVAPGETSAHASRQEAYEQWNMVCDQLEARGILDDMLVYDEETETCQLRSWEAERAEIDAHIAAYSHWYQRYDDIVTGKLTFPDPRAQKRAEQEASDQWEAAYRWLWQHGVPDRMLLYDSKEKIFSFPADWRPPLFCASLEQGVAP